MFYVSSLSHRTIIYKGMLNSDQLAVFYPELRDLDVESALAMVHSRFSTNTFPSWARAHPYRYLCHNGEINTLRGNVNWMKARESMFASRSLATTSKNCCRSSTSRAAIPPCSTMPWNCWCSRAGRCPMP